MLAPAMGMGRFEIHAENVADGETTYLGCRHLEKHNDLYAVLESPLGDP